MSARAWLQRLAPLLGLAAVALLFTAWGAVAKPDATFLTGFRVALIAKQSAIVGMGALGMTLVIAAGGIDLAAGSLLALASVVTAQALVSGAGAPLALALAAITGLACGALNGGLVTLLRLPPFLATLGTMLVLRGLAEQVAGQRKIPASAPDWLGGLLDPPGAGSWLPVSSGVVLVALLAVAVALVLHRTVFGRHVVAVGSSEATARLCGVPVERVKLAVYALGGLFAALAGVLEFANLNRQGNPTSGAGYELDVIAAVVLGGGSLSGGRGSVTGSLCGALLMTTLRSGCVFVEVPDPVQKVVVGGILVVAVALDRLRAR